MRSITPLGQPLVRSYAVTHPPDLHLPKRTYDEWDQLVHAIEGVMEVRTQEASWIVPPHRAIWIPAGTSHEVRISGRTSLRSLFFRQEIADRIETSSSRALGVPALLRELIVHACRMGVLYAEVPQERRLTDVILDQIELLPTVPLHLPIPKDPRASKAALLLRANPGDRALLARLGSQVGASRRTLERLFVAETQMTLGRWCQRMRIIAALRRLAEGESVTLVASETGYRSASAFIVAFRKELGTTPARVFDS